MENKNSLKHLNREGLIEYIELLEENVFNYRSNYNKKEIELGKCKLLVKDVLHSSNEVLKRDRFSEEVDYEKCVENLNSYINKYLRDNNLYL